MSDRLQEIKDALGKVSYEHPHFGPCWNVPEENRFREKSVEYVTWLIAEVERLRKFYEANKDLDCVVAVDDDPTMWCL